MANVEAGAVVPLEAGDGGLVKRNRHDERLSGVPQHRERCADQPAGEDPGDRFASSVSARHSPGGLAVGQVAIPAVDVAERRRLQDEQFERARTRCRSCPGPPETGDASEVAEAAVDEGAVAEIAIAETAAVDEGAVAEARRR